MDCRSAAYETEARTAASPRTPGRCSPRWRASISRPGAMRSSGKRPPEELHAISFGNQALSLHSGVVPAGLWPAIGSLLEGAARIAGCARARSAIIRPSSVWCTAIGSSKPKSTRRWQRKVQDLRQSGEPLIPMANSSAGEPTWPATIPSPEAPRTQRPAAQKKSPVRTRGLAIPEPDARMVTTPLSAESR